MGLSFDHPGLLHLLWAVPALTGVYMWGSARRRAALARFATVNLIGALVPSVSAGKRHLKMALVLGATALVVLAVTGPRWGSHFEEVERRGVDIMFVLDVSNSMLAEDVAPNRLERAKLDIKDMVEVLEGDRVGLVTFAGESSRTCPLTINYGAFRLALDAVDTRAAPRGGTNIGDAIRDAARSFTDEVKDHKAIVLISDGGETDESYAVEAAQNSFEERGIRVFSVGYGDRVQGGRIPVTKNGQRVYVTHQGQEVWTKLEPETLQSVAAVADGGYFTNTDFRDIHEHVKAKVDAQSYETARKQMKYPRFHWFAGAALALLMMEMMITDRKGGWR
ncbi:MAG: VWA domain-containing protein [Phycisphaerales bacterium]|nr:VWA domain-containing protein [Phycisphaerales bacterium]